MVIVKCTKRTGLKEFFGEKCFGTYTMANVDGWQPLETISYLLIWLIAYKLSPLKFQLRFSLWLAYYPPDFSLQFGFLKYESAYPGQQSFVPDHLFAALPIWCGHHKWRELLIHLLCIFFLPSVKSMQFQI